MASVSGKYHVVQSDLTLTTDFQTITFPKPARSGQISNYGVGGSQNAPSTTGETITYRFANDSNNVENGIIEAGMDLEWADEGGIQEIQLKRGAGTVGNWDVATKR